MTWLCLRNVERSVSDPKARVCVLAQLPVLAGFLIISSFLRPSNMTLSLRHLAVALLLALMGLPSGEARADSSPGSTLPALGAPGVAPCATDTGTCSQNALLQRLAQRLSSVISSLGSPLQAGGSVVSSPAGGNNTDASANGQSLAGLNLLGTLAANPSRKGYVIQPQDTATDCGGTGGNLGGLVLVFDDGASGTPTIILASYAASKGSPGQSFGWADMPHTGRIRYYGTVGCQVGAGQW